MTPRKTKSIEPAVVDDPEERIHARKIRMYQLFIGSGLFLAVLGIHAFVKELPLWFLAFPGIILGINVRDILTFVRPK